MVIRVILSIREMAPGTPFFSFSLVKTSPSRKNLMMREMVMVSQMIKKKRKIFSRLIWVDPTGIGATNTLLNQPKTSSLMVNSRKTRRTQIDQPARVTNPVIRFSTVGPKFLITVRLLIPLLYMIMIRMPLITSIKEYTSMAVMILYRVEIPKYSAMNTPPNILVTVAIPIIKPTMYNR